MQKIHSELFWKPDLTARARTAPLVALRTVVGAVTAQHQVCARVGGLSILGAVRGDFENITEKVEVYSKGGGG